MGRSGLDGQLRIIGGRWRGRRLRFAPIDGLRPTPDRVRETLFNWLDPIINGARCLDLFAGSGALGLEALSRGAKDVVFIERHPYIVCRLRQNLELLGPVSAWVEQTEALTWLRGAAQPFDVIFLDPPFAADCLSPICAALEQGAWLAPGARIYLEAEKGLKTLQLPPDWTIIREKTAGRVSYRLAIR